MPSVYLAPSFWYILTAAFGFTIIVLNRVSAGCWRLFNGLQRCKVAGELNAPYILPTMVLLHAWFQLQGAKHNAVPFGLGFSFFINSWCNFKLLACFFH